MSTSAPLSAAAEDGSRRPKDIILGHHYVAVTPQVYAAYDRPRRLGLYDEEEDRFLAPATSELRTY